MRRVLLRLDPSENSLRLPPPGLGTSETAPESRGEGWLGGVVGLRQCVVAALIPEKDTGKDSREGALC